MQITSSVVLYSKDIVANTITMIEKSDLLDKFYHALLFDVEKIYGIFSKMLSENKYQGVPIEEKITNFKNGMMLFQKLDSNELISQEKQVSFLTFILYNLFFLYENDSSRNQFLANENIQGLQMLMLMTNISFSCLNHVQSIAEIIFKECDCLKNNNLEDLRYQETLYKIVERLAAAILDKGIFNKVLEKVYKVEKETIVSMIELKNKTAKTPQKKVKK